MAPKKMLRKEGGMRRGCRRNRHSELLAGLFFLLFTNVPMGWAQQPGLNLAGSNQTGSVTARPVGNLEDWSSLSLANSELIPDPPLLGEKYDNPQFTRELLQVKWRQGDPIDLYVIRPKGVAHPPAILYLYSYPSETEVFRGDAYCANVTKGGFAAIGFVSALNGHRYTNRPMKEWFVSELQESLGSSVHDVQMILNYLSIRGDLDVNRVGMFGDGSGASIAILAAAADPRIKTLDLLDPWGDWPDWIKESNRIPEKERPDYLKPEWLADVAPLDPVKWLPELKTQTVRIQFIRDLKITPADVQQKIEAAVPVSANVQVVHYENTDAFRAAIAGGTGFDWIKQKMEFKVVPDYAASGPSAQSVSSQNQRKGPSSSTRDVQQ